MRQSQQGNTTPEDIVLTSGERQGLLQKMYDKLELTSSNTEAEAAAPVESRSTASPPPSKGAEAMMRSVSPPPMSSPAMASPAAGSTNAMEHAVLDTVQVGDDELVELASKRAHQVEEKILETGKLPAERLFLMDVAPTQPTNAASRVYFHLQ